MPKPFGKTKGKIEISQPKEAVGESVLFTSSAQGESDTFLLVYEFTSPGMIKAGNYLTSITLKAIR